MVRNTLMALGACLIVLSGCASEKFVGRQDLQVVNQTNLPPPTRSDGFSADRGYVIGPQDTLDIAVYGAPDLSATDLVVDASGTIGVPLVGEVAAGGLSPKELARTIETKLRGRYVRDPHVTVNPQKVSQSLTVDGQVKKPGMYPVLGRMTLMRSIAQAEGLSDYADTNYVVVFRQVNGQKMAGLYDLRAIRQGIYSDPDIYANDVVYVGESAGRRTFQAVIQSSALLTAPVIALLNRR